MVQFYELRSLPNDPDGYMTYIYKLDVLQWIHSSGIYKRLCSIESRIIKLTIQVKLGLSLSATIESWYF